jgi:thioredoxin-like negative regulator of GroEL
MVQLNQLNNFLIENKQRNIILFFSADYCTPCYALKNEFIKLQNSSKQNNMILINMEDSVDVGIQYKITKVPCLRVYNNLQLIFEYVGTEKGTFVKNITKYM